MRRELIRRYMTPMPHSIGVDQTLEAGHRLMREHGIRHLPVLHAGTLVGVVSLGDLHLVETLQSADPAKISIEEAMSADVYTVEPDTPLRDVCLAMAERKLGCAVVMDGDHLAGVFTNVDALHALSALLNEPGREPVTPRRRSASGSREAESKRHRRGATSSQSTPRKS